MLFRCISQPPASEEKEKRKAVLGKITINQREWGEYRERRNEGLEHLIYSTFKEKVS